MLEPALLAVLESIHDARGPVVFADLQLTRDLPDREQTEMAEDLRPLIDELGRRNANNVPHLVQVSPAGRAYIAQVRRDRDNPIKRAVACRDALLAWVPSAKRNGGVEHISTFEGHPAAHLHGSAFTIEEIDEAAEWLVSRQLVTPHRGLASMSLTLHHRGRTVLENWNGDTAVWDQRTNGTSDRGGNTYIRFGDGANVGNLVGRDNSGPQTANITKNTGLNPQDIQAWLASVQAVLPTIRVESEQLSRIEDAIEQLQTELAEPAPRDGMLCRLGRTVLDELGKGAVGLALPQLAPVVLGLIEAGQALFP